MILNKQYFQDKDLEVKEKKQKLPVQEALIQGRKNIIKESSSDSGEKTIDTNGHAYVDLGLPSGTLWATVCVGSENNTSGLGTICNYQEAVEISSSWRGTWTLPTKEQYDELIQYTDVSTHTIENFSGGRIGMWDFYSKEDSTKHIGIVFSQYYPGGFSASCWTSTPVPENNDKHYAYSGGQQYSGSWYNNTYEYGDSYNFQVLLVINP